jgi:hypothetical protein
MLISRDSLIYIQKVTNGALKQEELNTFSFSSSSKIVPKLLGEIPLLLLLIFDGKLNIGKFDREKNCKFRFPQLTFKRIELFLPATQRRM